MCCADNIPCLCGIGMKWVAIGFVRAVYDTVSHVWGDRAPCISNDMNDMGKLRLPPVGMEKKREYKKKIEMVGQVRIKPVGHVWDRLLGAHVMRGWAMCEDSSSDFYDAIDQFPLV
ncbi:hypothetical protein JCGZ_12117 [Jatropha curcas]|uniref:Uncharacterized protein n=1 Tax=Jatropha curcas TaxID=180498 RepID=A0A067KKN5_JATCU|nr:hypothetical protein JCGZ_12117 [Jatropha curcas]